MIPLPIKSSIVEEKKDLIKVEIDGLYPGYGVTIGNSLRRVLISSLPGAAAIQIKIKGAQHEFSTIPGVFEDVISIIMNIKQMRFKLHTNEPQKATLDVKGEKKVKGSDFVSSSQLEIINKDCHIATLTSKKSNLFLEILVGKGVGYEMVEQRKEQKKTEIGVIPIDSIFSPIKRVSYRVENVRVKDRTDFEKLFIDIETDGTVDPKSSFNEALQILVNHLNIIKGFLGGKKETKEEVNEEIKEEAKEETKKEGKNKEEKKKSKEKKEKIVKLKKNKKSADKK